MAAGLGFKDFTTGEVLTAADVDGYLMQGIWVFASAAARDAAVTSPQEGNFAFLKDTNTTTYYTGSAWANLDTTGMVNPMTTTGDMIYSSSGSTPARLGIGTAGQVLKVNSGATAPEWGAAGGASGLTKITSASFTAQSSVGVNGCFTNTYKMYLVLWEAVGSVAGADMQLQFQYSTSTAQTSDYYGSGFGYDRGNTLFTFGFSGTTAATLYPTLSGSTNKSFGSITFHGVGNASENPIYFGTGYGQSSQSAFNCSGYNDVQRTYTGFLLKPDSGTITGTYQVYGLEN